MDQRAVEQYAISTDAALAAVSAALQHARANACRVAVAVVDAGGNLVAFARETDAFLHSTGIAQDKAYTAASFGMPSAALHDLVSGNPALLQGIGARDRVAMFAGGFPIRDEGRLLGAIGVSGGSEAEDCACAEAGLRAIGL